MIPIQRHAESQPLSAALTRRTEKVREVIEGNGSTKDVRGVWAGSATARRLLREQLETMAPGVHRCMYCLDNVGTDIDHFQPIALAPLRTFDWHNHLLACSRCNSNEKREEYPCDEDGDCLLIDPTSEDPAEHLRLELASGEYLPETRKGRVSSRVFGLWRGDLMKGRWAAYVTTRSQLKQWHDALRKGDELEMAEIEAALGWSPFPNVLDSMERLYRAPHGPSMFTAPVREALGEWLWRSK